MTRWTTSRAANPARRSDQQHERGPPAAVPARSDRPAPRTSPPPSACGATTPPSSDEWPPPWWSPSDIAVGGIERRTPGRRLRNRGPGRRRRSRGRRPAPSTWRPTGRAAASRRRRRGSVKKQRHRRRSRGVGGVFARTPPGGRSVHTGRGLRARVLSNERRTIVEPCPTADAPPKPEGGSEPATPLAETLRPNARGPRGDPPAQPAGGEGGGPPGRPARAAAAQPDRAGGVRVRLARRRPGHGQKGRREAVPATFARSTGRC